MQEQAYLKVKPKGGRPPLCSGGGRAYSEGADVVQATLCTSCITFDMASYMLVFSGVTPVVVV